jgi:hypothetical protein
MWVGSNIYWIIVNPAGTSGVRRDMMKQSSARAGQRWSIPRMWSHAAPEEFLAPEPALPAQVYHLWHNTSAIAPERALALAVLNQAIMDLRRYQESGMRHHQATHDEARDWILSDDRSWPFSFASLCDIFSISVQAVRSEMLRPPTRGTRQAA